MSTVPWKEWIPGALNDLQLVELIRLGFIKNACASAVDYSSFDLRLDVTGYEMTQGSLKPQGGGYERLLARSPAFARPVHFEANQTKVLNPRQTYVFKLKERLSTKLKDSNIHGQATAKSSVGRVDVLARLIVDGMHNYEGFDASTWKEGNGAMFLEITPMTFPVRVKVGRSLSQLRLFQGRPEHSEMHGKELYSAVLVPDGGSSADDCLRVDLKNVRVGGQKAAAFRAKIENEAPVNLWVQKDKKGNPMNRPDPDHYWEPQTSKDGHFRVTHRNFYILRSKERMKLPRGVCVYCRANDETIGEMRIHYAGFAHPYFGHPTKPHQLPGTPLIFEVRGHDVDVVLNDNEPFCKHPPDPKKLSPYNDQTLKLSQFFDDFPIAN